MKMKQLNGLLKAPRVLSALTAGALYVALASTSQGTIVQYGLFDTGVDSAGSSLTGGEADPHYTLLNRQAVVVRGDAWPVPPWLDYNVANGSSRWISSTDGGGGGTDAVYTYATTFTLPTTPGSVALSGQWASDNDAEIYLNVIDSGHRLGAIAFVDAQGNSFTHYDSFSTVNASLFNAGQNTLLFVVHNGYVPPTSGDAGPFGLRVNDLSVDFVPVPEPATMIAGALLLLPFGASAVRRFRGQRAV